jgi:flagellar protein FlaG
VNIATVDTNSAMTMASVAVAAPRLNVTAQKAAGGDAAVNSEQVKAMFQAIQSQIQRMNVSLEFSRYGDRGERIAVVVSDKATGEVIREIPSREIQQLYNSINDLAGMIFDKQT